MKGLLGVVLLWVVALSAEPSLVVNVPTVVVHETPEDGSHIEDVIRYGTKVEVTDEVGEWARVSYPGWHGWVLKKGLLSVREDPATSANAWVGHRGAYVFRVADTEWGPFLDLPFETSLEVVEELPQAHQRWVCVLLQDGQTGYVQRSQIVFSRSQLSLEEMVKFSQQFLGSRYLWGGTSSAGYDCSGFVQMLYRQMGITLPRNSNQQAVDQKFVDVKPEEAEAGDLVFFRSPSGKVTHVGLMLNKSEFIHSFTKGEAWICISSLADDCWRNGYYYTGFQVRRLCLSSRQAESKPHLENS